MQIVCRFTFETIGSLGGLGAVCTEVWRLWFANTFGWLGARGEAINARAFIAFIKRFARASEHEDFSKLRGRAI